MTARWLEAIAAAGIWVLLTAIGIFVPTMLALAIYALRKGEPGDTDVVPSMPSFGPHGTGRRTGLTAYTEAWRLKALASRQTFISMESLVGRTATRGQWAVVVGIQVALVCFWLIFLGVGLIYLPGSNGASLALPAITGIWLLRILKSEWDDLVAAREKLARSDGRESGQGTR